MAKRILPRNPSRIHRFIVIGLACWLAIASSLAYAQPALAATLPVTFSGDEFPAVVGMQWSGTFQLVGGTGPFQCSMNRNIPGLTLTANTTGCVLSGAPVDFGSISTTISITDGAHPKNTGSYTLDFQAVAETQITAALRSDHPDGATSYVAGFPVWVHASVNFAPPIDEKLPAGTIQITSGEGGPSCSFILDALGEGECALIFPSAGSKTILLSFSSEDLDIRPSTASSAIVVGALRVPQSLSAGRNHTCHLDTNGWMTCWGRPDAMPVNKDDVPIPQGYFSKISAGGYQTCGLKVDGSIACWGDNTDVTQSIPTGYYVDISSGDEHVCAINTSNQLHCWGNLSYDVGAVPAGKVTAVSAGIKHDCAIRKSKDQQVNNRPICWGDITTAPNIAVKALAVGNAHTCAVKTDGTLACWGTLVGTIPAGTTFKTVGAGSAYSCAQKNDGTIACWGPSAPGIDSTTTYGHFDNGFLHTCALRPSGATQTLSCWGETIYGKAPRLTLLPTEIPQYHVKDNAFRLDLSATGGTGPYLYSIASSSLPTGLSLTNNTVSGTLTAAGIFPFTLAVSETTIGPGLPLQLTPALRSYSTSVIDGTTTTSLVLPSEVNAGRPAVATVTVNVNKVPPPPTVSGTVLVSSANGDTYCRAQVNTSGIAQCTLYFSRSGLQTVTARYEGDQYFKVSTTTGQITVNPVDIAPTIGAGNQFSCSIDSDGELACWGRIDPFQYPTPATGLYDQLDLGKSHACALGLNRQVTCWGWDGYGIATPPAITGVTRVTTGKDHTCLLTDLGRISCWGRNEDNRLSVPVLSGATYVDVDAGVDHSCAIASNGSVHCWGLNAADGRILVPSDLLSRGAVQKISSGGTFSCVLHQGGSAECWGGVGVVNSIRTEPTEALSEITAGLDFACGLKLDGSPVCWGNLTSAPVGPFTRLAAGFDHVCGILSNGRMQCWGKNDFGQAPVIAISPNSLPIIDVGAPWSTTISASGGRIPEYSYSIISGVLPAGLNSYSSTGVISGTPTQAGLYTFTVQAQEENLTPAIAATRQYNLTVRGLVDATIDSALPAGAMVGRPVQVSFSVRARAGNNMGAAPTGIVIVSAEDNLCEVLLVNGSGSCHMLFGKPGRKTIQITYPGDGLYQPSDPLAGRLTYDVIPFSQSPQLRTGLNQTYIYQANGAVGCIGANCGLNGLYTRLGAGDAYACGLQANGVIDCVAIDNTSPTLAFTNGPYIDLSVGKAHVCALQIEGQAECLGANTYGQSTPPAGSFTALSAGGGHTCALREDGGATCWGEIGAPPSGAFNNLISADTHTCGLRSDGTINCWGADSLGLLDPPASPAVFSQIAAGGSQTCGLDPGGEVSCWFVDTPDTPYSIYGTFIALAAYDDHVCGLRDGLKLTCWGEDDAGEAPQFTFEPLVINVLPALSYFEHAFKVSGGVKPLTAEVVEGQLPPGLDVYNPTSSGSAPIPDFELQDLSPAGMILYGAPSLPGVYPFVIRWTDVSTFPLVMEQPYTLTVTGGDLAVELLPFSSAEALVGMEYKFKAVVKNKTVLPIPGGIVLTINLPPGLTEITTDDPACALNGAKLTCTLGAVDPAVQETVWVTGKVVSQIGQTLEISASVASTLPDWPEIHNSDNSDSLTVKVAYNSIVFYDDFDLPPSPAWTGGTGERAPNGVTNYLSVPGNDALYLDLSGLPSHKKLVISFDVYIIGDWLGNNPGGSPSEWMFGVTGEAPLLRTSFSNNSGIQQAYPDGFPGGLNPARYGNTGVDELEYESGGSPLPDTRYRLSFKLNHTGEDLHLVFSSLNLPSGAWWGLDRMIVKIDSGETQLFLPVVMRTK